MKNQYKIIVPNEMRQSRIKLKKFNKYSQKQLINPLKVNIKKMRAFQIILSSFSPFLKNMSDKDIFNIGMKFPIPSFSKDLLISLCDEAKSHFSLSESLIELEGPLYCIGDIHGNIHDLFRIMNQMPSLMMNKILFLGDYVDRGSFSVEVISLLFSLKLRFPHNVFLLRGNHEFMETNKIYGFYDEIMERYNDESLYNRFNEIFEYLPIAATIGKKIFCVHGGISPKLNSIDDIKEISFPLATCKDELISDMMWSDPDKHAGDYLESSRGVGKAFGSKALREFFSKTGFSLVIRAHQCMDNGYNYHFHKKVITVFSTSYYSMEENSCAYLEVNDDYSIKPIKLNPIQFISRNKASFEEEKRIPENSNSDKFKVRAFHANFGMRHLGAGKISLSNFHSSKPKSVSPTLITKPNLFLGRHTSLVHF